MDEPPVIPAEPAMARSVGLGRIGLYISLVPFAALAALMLGKPG